MSAAYATPARELRANAPSSEIESGAKYNVSIGYLRAFVTLLVLAHHAALAYHEYGPRTAPAALNIDSQWWRAFPVVDSKSWSGFTLLVGWNDVFFMSLMFFLSGLFVWNSLKSKGAGAFLRGRALRLGLPFVLGVALFAPLAYYPTYLTTPGSHSFAEFTRQWLSLSSWPSGPAWFIAVLLAFDCIAAGMFQVAPKWGETLGRLSSSASRRPIVFFAILVAISAAAYLPMAYVFGVMDWFTFGPFALQKGRALHYAVYFAMGAGVGAYGINRGLLAPDGKLQKRWPLWLFASLAAFVLVSAITIVVLTVKTNSQPWTVLGNFAFVLSCAASCFGLMSLFVRFAKTPNKVFDSLRDNSYGMYLVHYAFVTWLQYGLLTAPLTGLAKGALVFAGAVALSWGFTAALRSIPAVRRVI